MIDNPLALVRALKGAPLSCLFAMAITKQPTGEDLLSSVTGYSDKTVSSALKTLKEFGLAVSTSRTHGWQLTGDALQLPLSNDLLESASRKNEIPHVGVVVELKDSIDSIKQQHQQPSGNSDSDFSREQLTVKRILSKAGLWPNAIKGLLDSDLRDVLGWIAYCNDPANGIRNAPALIAAQLKSETHPGDRYAPPLVCVTCHHSENNCGCQNATLIIPDGFFEKAFDAPPSWGRDEWLLSRWCCRSCNAFPCQCENDLDGEGIGESEGEV